MFAAVTDFEEMPINSLTDSILGACVEVHRSLGPGLLSNLTVGLLINFHAPTLRGQIRRIVNGAEDLASCP